MTSSSSSDSYKNWEVESIHSIVGCAIEVTYGTSFSDFSWFSAGVLLMFSSGTGFSSSC